MNKSIFIFLFIAVVSLVLSGTYFSLQADEKSENECPYLKNKTETTCPYLDGNHNKPNPECPYLNGELKSHSSTEDSESQRCPYLQKNRNSVKEYKTIKTISS